MKLNLQTKTKEQELIKKYLEENASEMLIDKINNPPKIDKDGKTLINKKDLDEFMKFACNEAKKLAEKGENSTCVQDNIVYGWAIHYFTEESIIGTLYNEDGTKYTPIVKNTSSTPTSYIPKIKKEEKPQISLFDMITNNQNNSDNAEETSEEDIEDAFNVMEQDNSIDKETGEIIATDKNDILSKIIEIFGNNIIVRN